MVVKKRRRSNLALLLAVTATCASKTGAYAPRVHHHVPHTLTARRASNTRSVYSPSIISKTSRHIHQHTTTRRSTALSISPLPIDGRVAGAALAATAKLLSTLGLGAAAARRPNLLDGDAVSALSRLIYNMFQPAFLFCSVAATVAGGDKGMPMRVLLLMPLAAIIQVIGGSAFSSLAATAAGLEGDERRDARICMVFANSGPLPLIFADALFSGTQLLTEITACVSFYLLMWTPTYWSYGRSILGTYGNNGDSNNETTGLIPKIGRELRKFFSPPVTGAALGLVAGSVPPLSNALLGKGGILSPFFGAMKTLGSAYLPAALLVLAGSLVGSKSGTASNDDDDDPSSPEQGGSNMKVRTIIAILFARFILAPIGGLATVHLLGAIGLLPEIGSRARAVVSFAILLESCMPPAQNTVVMLTIEGLTERAGRMAKALTILYSLAIVPVTVLLSIALHQSNIMALK